MKIRTVLLSLVLLVLASVSPSGTALAEEPPPDRGVVPDSPKLRFSGGQYPATAYGGGWYAVANQEFGKLKVHFFTSDGFFIVATYEVTGEKAYNPAIAYEASTGLFVLTWVHRYSDTDDDVYAVALDPENLPNPVVGSIVPVAATSANEFHPRVACNPNSSSCLIVWTHFITPDPQRVDARFYDIGVPGGLSTGTGIYTISTLTRSFSPEIAFGGSAYLVAYTWQDGSGVHWPVYSHVYPTYQTVGNQHMHDTQRLIQPGELNDSHNKFSESVAYDACAGVFVPLILYDDSGDASEYDLYVRPVHATNAEIGYLFPVAKSADNEYQGAISFIKGYHEAATPPRGNKLVVTYARSGILRPEGIYATDMVSNCSSASPQYQVEHYTQHTRVAAPDPSSGSEVSSPVITGGDDFQQFLVAWMDKLGSTGAFSVWGRLMNAAEKSYLPLVVK